MPDVWAELSSEVDAPPGTDSVRFFLVNRRESSEGVFALHLDDAYLVAPEPGGLAGAALLALAVAARARR